jgi:cyclophilin family peptidyl-prolyl cis-trans isomerase
MDRKRGKILVRMEAVLVVIFLGVGLGCDKRDWAKANQQGTRRAFQEYLRKHPDGKYTAMAWVEIERIDFFEARRQNTLAAFQDFLREYPSGSYKEKAKKEIALRLKSWSERLTVADLAPVRIEVETSLGRFSFRLRPEFAPGHARNMVYLATLGFYDGMIVNWVIKDKMVHLGAPANDSMGGPGYMIAAEINELKHVPGAVSMFHLPVDVNTAGSQFFICLDEFPDLDGNYTVFGEVVEGMTVLEKISAVEGQDLGPGGAVRPFSPITIMAVTARGVSLPP